MDSPGCPQAHCQPLPPRCPSLDPTPGSTPSSSACSQCHAGGSKGAQVGCPLGPADFGTWVLLQQLHKLRWRCGHVLKEEFTTQEESPNNAEPGQGDGKPSASQLFMREVNHFH